MSDPPKDAPGAGPAPGGASREGGPAPEPVQGSSGAGVEALRALQGFEFVIERDGSVTFVDFPPELLDIAYALNPDDPLVCERRALLGAEDDPEDPGGG